MREIKFEAWNKKERKILRNLPIVSRIHYGASESFLEQVGLDHCLACPEYYEVRQYTGLKDKNGKEIYEGDIVRACFDYGPGGDRDEVIAVEIGPWGVNIQQWNYEENRIPEVIGNIYENSDLLEEKP